MVSWRCNVSDNNIQIVDSWIIKDKSKMTEILGQLRNDYPNNKVLNSRSNESLIREWKGHNLLYKFNILPSHTKDVDLDINRNAFYDIGYFLMSIVYDIVK